MLSDRSEPHENWSWGRALVLREGIELTGAWCLSWKAFCLSTRKNELCLLPASREAAFVTAGCRGRCPNILPDGYSVRLGEIVSATGEKGKCVRHWPFFVRRSVFQTERCQQRMVSFDGVSRSDHCTDTNFAGIDHLHIHHCGSQCLEHLLTDTGMASQADPHH